MIYQLAFLDGVTFDIFFRGLLSVIVLFLILVGGTYLLIATNIGVRNGFLIASAGFFGWMFLMGIFWTVYAKGWIGEAPTWHQEEQLSSENRDLLFASNKEVAELDAIRFTSEKTDPDEAQLDVVEQSKNTDIGGWKYLPTSDAVRGDAQSAAVTFLTEDGGFLSNGETYVPLQFGAFSIGGKPTLKEDARWYDRATHFFDETVLTPTHPEKLVVIQFQGAKAAINATGEAPATLEADPNKPVYSVIMSRDRGGPLPSLISGQRFTPFAFTVAMGMIFLAFVLMLHSRDKRYEEVAGG